ncbi:HAMP domain-containing sensor histidine kinase [Actinoplanes sp. NPDC051411]|uniref:HAMP domain-containing sensor histidine kinase n=1 Tax=Actinoplanes sp. NPDC051411 TaxID=3155522 RepID=UPI00343A207D
MRRLVRWWRRRTLRARLSLLVTGAVAAAVVTIAVVAWLAVGEIQHHQTQSQLTSEAAAIVAQPDQWRNAARLPEPRDGHRHSGLEWQIVDSSGAVVSHSATALPVTANVSRPQERPVRVGGDDYLMLTVPLTGGGAVSVAINQDPDENVLTILGLLLLGVSVVGVAGAAFLGRAVARAGLAPVERLTGAVEDVTGTLDLGRPLPVDGADEIARLGASVNTLLAAIDTARRAQRTLIEDASHEMRTPMTSIRTNIELLLEVEKHPELAHRLPPDERAKLLADLNAQMAELATLTTELVELARDESTREAAEDVELTDVIEAAVIRVRIRAPRVRFATDLQPAVVHGRPGELERMVVNILDNAAKWSPPDSTVEVTLKTGERPVLTVADHGPGIDEGDRPYVFDRFYRATAARSMPGSGLGLAIVAQTVAQHGGTVTAGPNEPRGTVITVLLGSS